MSQLSLAYGGQTHEDWGGGMGQPGFTQGFSDFFTGEGYYADPRGTYLDGGWNISDKPINLGVRGGTLDPYGNMQPQDWNWGPHNPSPGGKPYSPIQQSSPGGIGFTIADDTASWGTGPGGWRPEPGTEGDKGLMMQSVMNSLGGRPSDIMQLAALQGGLGALQGPTQKKIQQGIGALV